MINKIITYLKEGALCAYWRFRYCKHIRPPRFIVVRTFPSEITEAIDNSYSPSIVGGCFAKDT
jgi:hypothetical protein